MAAGFIPITQVPGYPNIPAGIYPTTSNALIAAGFRGTVTVGPDGVEVSDVPTATNAMNAYPGSADELNWNKTQKQSQLDIYLTNEFNLIAFIMNGTLSNLTGTNVANFLASTTNNYRSKKAQIAACTTVAQVQAIDVTAGWPANP